MGVWRKPHECEGFSRDIWWPPDPPAGTAVWGRGWRTATGTGAGDSSVPWQGSMGGSHGGVTIEISPSWARSQHGTSGPHPMGDDVVGSGSGLGFGAVSPRCIFLPQLHGAHKKGRPPP